MDSPSSLFITEELEILQRYEIPSPNAERTQRPSSEGVSPKTIKRTPVDESAIDPALLNEPPPFALSPMSDNTYREIFGTPPQEYQPLPQEDGDQFVTEQPEPMSDNTYREIFGTPPHEYQPLPHDDVGLFVTEQPEQVPPSYSLSPFFAGLGLPSAPEGPSAPEDITYTYPDPTLAAETAQVGLPGFLTDAEIASALGNDLALSQAVMNTPYYVPPNTGGFPYGLQPTDGLDFDSNVLPDPAPVEPAPRPTRKSKRSTGSSSSSAPSGPILRGPTQFRVEKPKPDQEHPWVRTNKSTTGKNTRSGKINQFDPEAVYQTVDHPHGPWTTSSGHTFDYNRWSELTHPTYTRQQIQEFIFEHPRTKHCRLKLWIQKSPSDSARRYPTLGSSKCRFRDCPAATPHKGGTILHGHYRVALDERWHRYHDNVDPFIVAGYVHLYCLERFCDLPAIIRTCDVSVDTRELFNEPRHSFAATLRRLPEGAVAARFVQLCRRNSQSFPAEYPDYPPHGPRPRGQRKPHDGTLTRLMHEAKLTARPAKLTKTLERRGNDGGKDAVHLGDLEVYVAGRREQAAARKRKRRREVDGDDTQSEIEVAQYEPPPKKRMTRSSTGR